MTTGGVMVKIEVKTEVEVDTHQLNMEVKTLFNLRRHSWGRADPERCLIANIS